MSRLRSALAPYGISLERRGDGYRAVVEDSQLDARRFERLVAEAASAAAADDQARAAELAGQALGLWRGAPLADVSLYDGGRAEVARLAELRLLAVEQRVEAELALGRGAELVSELGALVEANPYRERLVAQLMVALYRAGRQADALELYERTRARLDSELGLKPSRELQQLAGQIVRHELPARSPADGNGKPDAGDDRPGEPRALRRRSRDHLLAAAAVICGVVAVGVVVSFLTVGRLGSDESPLVASAGNALAVVDPGSGKLVADVPVGSTPTDVAVGAGAVWVANAGSGTVDRIDPETRTVRQTIRVGSSPGGIAVGDGYVWVVDGLEGSLFRVDPRSNEVTQEVPVGNGPSGVAVDRGAVWVVNRDDHELVRLDPGDGKIVARVDAGADPVDVAAGGGAVWVTNGTGEIVRKLDRRTGRSIESVGVGRSPGAVAVGAGSVWVANTLDGTVSRIDASRAVVTSTIPVGEGPSGVVATDDAVWVTAELGGALVRIDPETNEVVRIPVGGRPAGVAIGPAGVYVAVRPDSGAHVGGTLSVALELSSIDTHFAESWELLGLTNDGLTAYRRIGGQAGAQIVPGLATSVPRPDDGGRTYVFRLRSGLRYSTGAPVRPRDVRRSLERLFEVESPNAFLYESIAGASVCGRSPGPCDLSRGIVVDDRLRTVTFRLVEPDPDLPAKLALPYAFLVPGPTPSRDTGTRPLPATGPYAIASYVPGRQLRLIRNPHFRERPFRPAGAPDEIVVRIGLPLPRQVRDVARGAVDVANLTGAPDLVEIRQRYGSRLHTNPWQALLYVFLNTKAPPFDDVRVRRAVNLAVDRALAVRSFGGEERAAASCQVLPPSFPGYSPYCPYGRDLGAARRLVAASGTRGSEVVVWTMAWSAPTVRPVVSALRALGYRTRLESLPDDEYFNRVHAGRDIQAGFYGWTPNYVSPADFLVPFTCREASTGSANRSNFCDRRIERLVHRALRLRATDQAAANAVWARADRAVTGLAPLVPLLNPRAAHFVSERVGNYQFSPVWGVLLEQLWVR